MKKKIRVGIWGLGRAGYGMHLKELKKFEDEFEVVAVCDLEQDRLDVVSKEYPGVHTYLDGDQFIKDPDVDMISVAVRSPDHVAFAIRALETGKYVFIEKPIALTMKAVKKLAAAAKKFPGKLYPRQNRRFEPCFNHVFEIMKSGILGDVYEIKLCRHNYQWRNDWQTIVECGGGQLNNWGPHLIDHSLQLMEAPIAGIWSNLKRIAALGDAEDHLKIVFTGENDRIIDVEISGGIALASPVYAVYGTRGSLISKDEKDIQLRYLKPECKFPKGKAHPENPPMKGSFGGTETPEWVEETIPVAPSNKYDTDDIYHYVYQAIRENKKFPVALEESFKVVEMTEKVKLQNPMFPLHSDNL
ncbi:MAG: Gfo/Idh/MocA family oxidoreductase [Lentisphaeria bacterium]